MLDRVARDAGRLELRERGVGHEHIRAAQLPDQPLSVESFELLVLRQRQAEHRILPAVVLDQWLRLPQRRATGGLQRQHIGAPTRELATAGRADHAHAVLDDSQPAEQLHASAAIARRRGRA